jgi:hypothetical protein
VRAAHQLVPHILAGATLILLAANAVPTVQRKHRLLEQKRELLRKLEREQERGRRLEAEIRALQYDPFCVQKELAETWRTIPAGTIPWDARTARTSD